MAGERIRFSSIVIVFPGKPRRFGRRRAGDSGYLITLDAALGRSGVRLIFLFWRYVMSTAVKRYCLRKGNFYIAWDGKTLTEKPHEGIRLSRTVCERKYPGYEMLPFPEAYRQWYEDFRARREGGG
jgi:hypothetical protein